MSDIQCFLEESEVISTPFGDVLTSPNITVGWLSDSAALAYYTLICFFLMIAFLFCSFWREKMRDMGVIQLSILVWRVSILIFAFCAIVGGITRFAIFLGVVHNVTGTVHPSTLSHADKRSI
jgi:hypothetical protein